MKDITELSDKELDAFIKNYQRQEKETGGVFPLCDLRLEKHRRIRSPFPPADMARTIMRLAAGADDGLVSYKQVWQVFRPDSQWIGNAPRTEMAKALGQVIAYCIDNDLPIVTTLVVQAASRRHSEDATVNIFNEAKMLGVEVGSDPAAFVQEQQLRARELGRTWSDS